MKEKIILVMDCGATNVRAIAVNEKGQMLAMHSIPNNTQADPINSDYRIWDVEEIWDKLKKSTHEILKKIDKSAIAGITITTFGVDGAPVDKNGKLLNPVISWQCSRTHSIMNNIAKYIPLADLFKINGLQAFSFNTINKLIWYKENRPDVLDKMDHYLFIPSIFINKLTGEFANDITMAGTSMLTDIQKRDFSDTIFTAIGVDKKKFYPIVNAGDVVGKVTERASQETGIPSGIPVVATGHDTQFAIFGSGAEEGIPVLSTGTWEILMVRSSKASTSQEIFTNSITTEFDAANGLYNPGCQWIGSGLLEWIKKIYFAQESSSDSVYEIMISSAEKINPGSNGVMINPSFFQDTEKASKGAITGLTLNTTREAIYRACLEALSCKLKMNLEILENAGGFKSKSLIVVGGGSKNRLWNQIRADVLGIPIHIIDHKETTVLGAALFAMAGIGIYPSANDARKQVKYNVEEIKPSANSSVYKDIYQKYKTILS